MRSWGKQVLSTSCARCTPFPTCNSPNHADVCFRGLWNVPFVSNCYLINATIIANKATRPSYEDGDLDTEMAFAHGNRQRGLFMYVNNRLEFGHLVDPDTYDIRLTYPDMYQIMENKLDWERRYIHPNYSENFNPDKKPIQVKIVQLAVNDFSVISIISCSTSLFAAMPGCLLVSHC